jgi:hypothetical protein
VGWTSGPPVLEGQDRMRANFESGARQRFRPRTKVALVLAVIILLVGSCASAAWTLVGQYLSLDQQIARDSSGEVEFVLIVGGRDTATVLVYMSRGVGDAEARNVVCGIVVPELTAAGVSASTLQVYSSSSRLIASGIHLCSAPIPTTPPSPAPNSGQRRPTAGPL